MNKFEKYVYDRLKHNPRIKILVRNIYQKLFDLLPATSPISDSPITTREGFFFGFHDHTPFSHDDTKLLANRYLTPLRMPKLNEFLEVGYFEGENFKTFVPIDQTCAWMWHLGCKLQWRGDMNQIVFNDHVKGKNVARMVDINTKESTLLPDSIGSVSPDGKWAVGYSFARVQLCMPGYGYDYDIDDDELNEFRPHKNGIHIINLESLQKRLLLSIDELANIQPEESMDNAMHFVTHTVFSPSSNRFIFLHRWIHKDVTKRWSRMISCSINGDDVFVFPTIDMVSHIGWKSNNEVIAYCRVKDFDDQYVLFKDQAEADYSIVGLGSFNSDGHPSFESSGQWMITDVYPDRRREQRLVLFDIENNVRRDIAKLPMPKSYQSPDPYSHWACDLHPRWNRRGTMVCFDTTFTGVRSLSTMNVSEMTNPLN
jgi:hypothetical protein